MQNTIGDSNSTSISIGRQPVFDDSGRLWGYELFCVGNSDAENAALGIQSSAYISLQQILESKKKIIVDFSEKNVLDHAPDALPPSLAAVKVEESAGLQALVMHELRRLKGDGYLIAVSGFSDNSACEDLYRLADIIAIDTRDQGRDSLLNSVIAARRFGGLVLADRVRDRVVHGLCKVLGFSLFHGAFFKSSETLTVRKLSSNEVLRLELLRAIEEDEPDLIHLADTIQSDATISYRMLAYLNSAEFAFVQKIVSIRQAITLLGWTTVRGWLRVVLLSDMGQGAAAQELVLLSAQRGMFLKLVVSEHDFWGFDPESLHLLGIFSLLDALMMMPMQEIVRYLPIDRKLKAALLHDPNSEYLPLLQLAQYLEESRWQDADTLSRRLNLNNDKVITAFRLAIARVTGLRSIRTDLG
jgi:EAL and modified HD-GYP domain-containing signal transduction protein